MNAAVLALGDLAADRLAVIDLAAIGAEIEPSGVGVLRHHAVGGADEARRVHLVVARHWKLQDVDGAALDHVLEDRAVIDEARRQRLQVLHPCMIFLHHVDLPLEVERQAERQRDAAGRGKLAVKRAVAFRIARDVVEQDRRRGAAALLREHVGDGAHLDVPVGAVDLAQFPELVDLLQPAAQPAILHLWLRSHLSAAGHALLRLQAPFPQVRPIVYTRILM